MREIEPFAYFLDHASAIGGLGGSIAGPDPRYCFHTGYQELPSGQSIYRFRLTGVQASKGELSIRVHGYKPESASDVSIVAGRVLRLHDLGNAEKKNEISIDLPFLAVPNVRYALYGFFSDPSDMVADRLTIELGAGLEGPAQGGGHLATRVTARSDFTPREFGGSGSLESSGLISLRRPVSQDCTLEQLTSLSEAGIAVDQAIDRWRADIVNSALRHHGMDSSKASGTVIGCAPQELKLPIADPRSTGNDAGQDGFDFLISFCLELESKDAKSRFEHIEQNLTRLLRGGIAIFVLRRSFAEDSHSHYGSFSSRNEIAAWALRLIGMGHDVAPLSFAQSQHLACYPDSSVPFVFIVRRALDG